MIRECFTIKMTNMKYKFFITICILFISTVTLLGQEKNGVRYVKVDSNNNTKEYTVYNKKDSSPIYKSVYEYNDNDNNMKRTTYFWNIKKGWVEIQKYDYVYNEDKQPMYIIYTKWDKNSNKWAETSEVFINLYDKNNKFVATQKVKMDNKDNKFLVLK